ncbi:MAG: hypothetical protein IPP72_14725 [Chitinophagaceae bacterium]|nr:hypothetical protein [Chitinophagaceae bacterium]
MFSVSAGLSYAVINYHTVIPDSEGWFGPSFTLKKVNSISFPVSLKMNIPTKTALGLTLELKMDINKEKSIFGLMAGLRIGRIKSRRM